jgi:hypothetical protein
MSNMADGGYHEGNNWSDTPNGLNTLEPRQKSLVRAHDEAANVHFKMWLMLGQKYRHKKESHGAVFSTIANITQLSIQNEEPLFQVDYNDSEH